MKNKLFLNYKKYDYKIFSVLLKHTIFFNF